MKKTVNIGANHVAVGAEVSVAVRTDLLGASLDEKRV